MKPFHLLALAFALIADFSACAALPEFKLADGESGGRVCWFSNPTDKQIVVGDNTVIEVAEDQSVSLGLHWSTEADPISGECLITSGMWRVPMSILTAQSYTISAE